MSKRIDPKRIVREGYDQIGATYRPWADASDAETRRWFLSEVLARIPGGSDVLELGCGPGVDATLLAQGRRYTGVDLSPRMIELARTNAPSGTFIEHDLVTLDRPADSFDAVVSLYVFGHIPADEHGPCIRRVFAWLRPGGVFCASFPLGSGDTVEENFIGVPMFFGGIGTQATQDGLRAAGFVLELLETRIDTAAVRSGFLWVIARKPA